MSRNELEEKAIEAQMRTTRVYEEAIAARLHLDLVVDSIPLDQHDLYEQARGVLERSVQVVNAAWHAKYEAEHLLEDIRKIR